MAGHVHKVSLSADPAKTIMVAGLVSLLDRRLRLNAGACDRRVPCDAVADSRQSGVALLLVLMISCWKAWHGVGQRGVHAVGDGLCELH